MVLTDVLLAALELSKKEASQKLQELSRLYTKAPDNEDEPPHHKYTLRGVSADPHTTYVLEKTRPENDNDLLRLEAEDWQWWKISYSVGDAKPVSHTVSPPVQSALKHLIGQSTFLHSVNCWYP